MMHGHRTRSADDYSRSGRVARFRPAAPRGFSMIEAVVSVALVGGVLVAALSTLAHARQATATMDERAQAGLLVHAMLSEIMPLAYQDPELVTLVLGPDSGESGLTRAAFDDVDDYHGWSSAPQTKSGAALAGFSGWTVSVTVQYVSATNFQTAGLVDFGVKKITVTAARGGVTLHSAVALRTDAPGRSRQILLIELS